MEPGQSYLAEVHSDDAYALTPSYTLIRVEGTGQKGTSVVRVRYPDGSDWWAVSLYELRDGRVSRFRTYFLYEIRHGRISRSRTFFAPDFDAPEWRAPYREAP